ncbi:hypothetical protein V6B14_08565 [Sporosarcina psychrophila]|uniref:hypothetical protein n=1 Tax=Sporosarcina psychrophila TaxID=1476 RepID=UPI0030CADC18
MSISNNKEIKIAYELDTEKIKYIDSLMQKFSDEVITPQIDPKLIEFEKSVVSYSAELSDGATKTFTDLEDLISYQNYKNNQIISIRLSHSIGLDNYISLTFSSSQYIPIRYSIKTTEERDYVYYDEKIMGFIQSLKTKFSFFAISNAYVMVAIIVITELLILMLLTKTEIDMENEFSIISILMILTFPFVYIVEKFKKKILPIAEFKIGDGVKRAEHRSWIRNSLFIALIIGIAASLIAGAL